MNKIIVGIDEAGRGPAIGPLVICAYSIAEDDSQELKKAGVKDSKMLSSSTRDQLYKKLSKGTYAVRHVTAIELTIAMQKKISLNELEAKVAGELLNELERKTNFYRAYIDSPDPEPTKYATRIRKYYHGKAELVSENKADVNYPVASAASIIAKVERDREIQRIRKIVGEDFGSGYPADPITIDFLRRRHNDEIVQEYMRQEWATVKNLKAKTKQTGLAEF